MSALLAQMNPHFLFNCLNSIDSYIIKNESKKASEYLNSFARLMRLILQNSRSNYISLKDESRNRWNCTCRWKACGSGISFSMR